jgi:hypothetical protein
MYEINQKTVGSLTISEAKKLLEPIALSYGLKLNRLRDFKLARLILVNLYNRELL